MSDYVFEKRKLLVAIKKLYFIPAHRALMTNAILEAFLPPPSPVITTVNAITQTCREDTKSKIDALNDKEFRACFRLTRREFQDLLNGIIECIIGEDAYVTSLRKGGNSTPRSGPITLDIKILVTYVGRWEIYRCVLLLNLNYLYDRTNQIFHETLDLITKYLELRS